MRKLMAVLALLGAMMVHESAAAQNAQREQASVPAVTPGKWQGKSSGAAVRPRVKRGLPPSEAPCSKTSVRYKNGCAEIVETRYLDANGTARTVSGLPPGFKIGEVMSFSWKACASRKVRLEGTKVDADAHIVCLREVRNPS